MQHFATIRTLRINDENIAASEAVFQAIKKICVRLLFCFHTFTVSSTHSLEHKNREFLYTNGAVNRLTMFIWKRNEQS